MSMKYEIVRQLEEEDDTTGIDSVANILIICNPILNDAGVNSNSVQILSFLQY